MAILHSWISRRLIEAMDVLLGRPLWTCQITAGQVLRTLRAERGSDPSALRIVALDCFLSPLCASREVEPVSDAPHVADYLRGSDIEFVP